MTCQSAKSLLSEHLDCRLETAAAAELKEHLGLCQSCRRELELLRGVVGLLGQLPRHPLPESRSSPPTAKTFPFRVPALALGALFVGLISYKTSRPTSVAKQASVSTPLTQAPVPNLSMELRARKTAPAALAFDNDAQARKLQEESELLGIEVAGSEQEPPASQPFLGPRLGVPGVRENAEAHLRQLIELRHSIEESSGKLKPVPIEGKTAPLLGVKEERNGRTYSQGAWRGSYSGGNEGTRTITDNKTWKSLWPSLSPEAPPPEVDFSRQEVVAVFLGQRPSGGYSVEILSADPKTSAVIVRYRESFPAPGIPPPEGATTPYALLSIPKSDLPVRFELVR